MKKTDAIKMMKALLECRERGSSPYALCNHNCDECSLCYEQGNIGEQKAWLKLAIKTMEENNDTSNNI